jgi:hypothetical protein
VDIRAFGLERFVDRRPLEGSHPYAPRLHEPELDRDAAPAGG